MNKLIANKTISYIAIVAWSFMTMLSLAMVSGLGITGIDLVLPCLFALSVIVYKKVYDSFAKVKQDFKYTIPLGCIAGICYVVGSKIDMEEHVFNYFGIVDIGHIIILIPFFVSLFILLFKVSDYITHKLKTLGIIGNKVEFKRNMVIKKIAIYAAIMFVCWLPYYLAFYPGGVNNDDFECLNTIFGNIPWTNHHPVSYTATMMFFVKVFGSNGNIEFALGIMTICQMIMVALSLSASVVWLEYHGTSKIWRNITIAFMSLHSAYAMFSIKLTKDIIFACVMVLLVPFLYDLCAFYKSGNEDKKKDIKLCAILGVLSLLSVITRNNGTFVILIMFIALLVVLKRLRKQLLIVTIIVFAINGLYKGPVWKALDIQKQSFVESAAIPLTQIAYTICNDGVIEGDDKAYLESVMPFEEVKKNYSPGYVDSYKFDPSFNTKLVDDNPGQVIKVWVHLLPHNFGLYVKAYLIETCGYWHYGITNTLCSEGVQPNNLGLKGTDYIEKFTGVSFAGLFSKCMLVVRKLPILCIFTQMAAELLSVILIICQFVRRKKSIYILSVVPLVAIWLSIMIASPSYCLFRYMLPFFYLWPVIIFNFCDGTSEAK